MIDGNLVLLMSGHGLLEKFPHTLLTSQSPPFHSFLAMPLSKLPVWKWQLQVSYLVAMCATISRTTTLNRTAALSNRVHLVGLMRESKNETYHLCSLVQ